MGTLEDNRSMSDTVASTNTPADASNIELAQQQPTFPFSHELELFWARCSEFVKDVSSTHRLHPLHMALCLLFDGLAKTSDSRLTDWVPQPDTLERPLFWVAVTKVSQASLPSSLDDHLRDTVIDESNINAPPLQFRLGQALWKNVYALKPATAFKPLLVDYDEHKGMFDNCCEDTRIVLVKAKEICDQGDDRYMAPHHLLQALLLCRLPENSEDPNSSKNLCSILEDSKLPPASLIEAIRGLRQERVMTQQPRERFGYLKAYATDHTRELKEKRDQGEMIDPIIGRNREIRSLISILSRRTKSNAVLLGDSGVGKTAIADGLAWRILEGDVPESVVAHVFRLDLSSLLASTACKSAYEQIVQLILDEIYENEERGVKIILFIDELSDITIGGYRGDGTGLDAATLMKPYLATGRLHLVGCSTFEDYRTSIESDGALARQFSCVHVCEPSVEHTVDILRAMKPNLEKFHRVRILDEAFVTAAEDAAMYFASKRLPDSAIEVLDEACTNVKIDSSPEWEKLGKWKRHKAALEMDIESLERDTDERSVHQIGRLRGELDRVKTQIDSYKTTVDKSRPVQKKLAGLEEKIEQQRKLMRELRRNGLAKQRQEVMASLASLLREREQEAEKLQQSEGESIDDEPPPALPAKNAPVVTKRHIRFVVASHRPGRILDTESGNQGVQDAEKQLSERIYAQEKAVEAVAGAVNCLLAGLTDPSRPVASFLLGGPSGSGKTLIAKELARLLLGSCEKLIRINGSDYAESHSLTRLIGTPICTGFDQGGQLTECVRRRPFSVVLIEDIEKASQDFMINIQTILDVGQLRDGTGQVINFSNCIVIITTGVGKDKVAAYGDDDEERRQFSKQIREHFPVEFLARVDELVVLNRIKFEAMDAIVESRLNDIRALLLRNELSLTLVVDDDARDHLVIEGWSAASGARRLETMIRSQILLPLSSLILEDAVQDGWCIHLVYDEVNHAVVLETEEPGFVVLEDPEPTLGGFSRSPSRLSSRSSITLATSDLDIPADEEEQAGSGTTYQRYLSPHVLRPMPQRLF